MTETTLDPEFTDLDRRLESLFAPVRPGASMESRLVYALRNVPARPKLNRTRKAFVWATAATVGLGTLGAGISLVDGLDGMPMPGNVKLASSSAPAARTYREVQGLVDASPAPDEESVRFRRGAGEKRLEELSAGRTVLSFDAGDTFALDFSGSTARMKAKDGWKDHYSNDYLTPGMGTPDGGAAAPAGGPMGGGGGGRSGGGSVANGTEQFYLKAEAEREVLGKLTVWDANKKLGEPAEGKKIEDAQRYGYFFPPEGGSAPGGKPEQGKGKENLADLPQLPTITSSPTDGKFVGGGGTNLTPKGDDTRTRGFGVEGKDRKLGDADGTILRISPDQAPAPVTSPAPQPPPVALPAVAKKIVIRSGEMEFEVESFDNAVATVTALTAPIPGGFVSTVNSEKLPNGKVRGVVVVRIPPEKLDQFVLDLRRDLGKAGELKGSKIGSQDVTKLYTDMESRLRAARAMEERLLKMIKEGDGSIKELLEAEKELGVWRTKIEETEGELKYYANLAALSTLTITVFEKEIRAAVGVTESERVNTGVEVEDVEAAFRDVQKAVADAKGRVTKSELKQQTAGQLSATLHFEVAPESAGPVHDRLKQLGRVARFEIDRVQQADSGPAVARDAKVKKGDTLFFVELYNLANIEPREVVTVVVSAADVPKAYQALRDAVAKVNGRVFDAQVNEQDKQNVTATLKFDVRRTDEGATRLALDAAGEAIARNVVRAPEGNRVTDSKVKFNVTMQSANLVRPRETAVLGVVVPDVPAAYQSLREIAAKAGGQVITAQLNEQDKQNVTATLHFEAKRGEEGTVRSAIDAAGDVVSRTVSRVAEGTQATDAKVLYQLSFSAASRIRPRETAQLGLEVSHVETTVATVTGLVSEAKGRSVDVQTRHDPDGKVFAHLVYDVPLAAAPALVDRIKAAGKVRVSQTAQDKTAPDGKFATARLEVKLANAEAIVGPDDGIGPKIKKGLSYSANVLLTSLTWVVFGLCVVLPWALVGFAGYRIVRRVMKPAALPKSEPASPAERT